eukprot:1829753-Amphidinium_carterae.1
MTWFSAAPTVIFALLSEVKQRYMVIRIHVNFKNNSGSLRKSERQCCRASRRHEVRWDLPKTALAAKLKSPDYKRDNQLFKSMVWLLAVGL